MNNNELRGSIQAALQSFESKTLRKAAISLLNILGYSSDKTIEIPGSDPQAFLELLVEHNPDIEINKGKALFDDWLKADVLFQLTDEELSHETSLFKDDAVDTNLLRSYLFFAIELKRRDYARGRLTAIARQLNRMFPMPVMVLIKHGDLLSMAVINRRLNKRDADKDVLGKVTIIRHISLAKPHRGHLDILQSFALPSLLQQTAINSFDTLHAVWEEIFNVELLNKRFYKELFKWYFWALPEVRFPDDMKSKRLTEGQESDYYEKLRATGLIRLLTRLIFCWFLKEKGLIPESLFDKQALNGVLKNLDDDKPTYYQAILQNLFFATLNQRMNTHEEQYRRFAKDEGFLKNRNKYGVYNLYRYESLFKNPDAALKEFEDIPFLNGGLFECLDRPDDNNKTIYVDGFSRNHKKRSNIPNRFFFGEGEVNIGAVTGEKRRGTEKASGLIHILSNYKFTIDENTPIDQEIALDPELLGKVFENLLASYNEETKTTARKQTGSFYTPRPIVDYMVDESLKAHLTTALGREHAMTEEDARAGLDILFTYTEKQHPFEEDEVDTLIRAIDTCKILDPACGSGAFPMGVLHKLVYILTKLDPDNARWKQTQLDKLDSVSMRDKLERTFENNNDDYGRKLYLIENCLYGVDIQPIAIQISKLRFFISLICDQKTNKNKAQNHGVNPLPNLETKFVAANTLIGFGENIQMELFKSKEIERTEAELKKVRHDYFAAQRRQQKLSLQKKDEKLRKKLANELIQVSFSDKETSQRLAQWNPYDPHIAADFFEPLWMFDHSIADGFDLVIGNPPYLSYGLRGVGKLTKKERTILCDRFPNSAEYKISIYAIFMEKCIALSRSEGVSSLIVPDSFLLGKYFSKIRSYMLRECEISLLLLIKDRVFDNVTVGQSAIYVLKRKAPSKSSFSRIALGTEKLFDGNYNYVNLYQEYFKSQPRSRFRLFFDGKTKTIIEKIDSIPNTSPLKKSITFRSGLIAKAGQATIKGVEKKNNFWLPGISSGGMVKRYFVTYQDEYLCYEPNKIKSGGVATVNYKAPKLFVRQTGDAIICAFDDSGLLALNNVHIGEGISERLDEIIYFCAVLNSSVVKFYYRSTTLEKGRTLPQIDIDVLDDIPVPVPLIGSLDTISKLVRLIIIACATSDSGMQNFIDELVDACVMECYFPYHMQEHDLVFIKDISAQIREFNPGSSKKEQLEFLIHFYQTSNEPDHPVRNRLLRMTADSPDLLAVIKGNGTV